MTDLATRDANERTEQSVQRNGWTMLQICTQNCFRDQWAFHTKQMIATNDE